MPALRHNGHKGYTTNTTSCPVCFFAHFVAIRNWDTKGTKNSQLCFLKGLYTIASFKITVASFPDCLYRKVREIYIKTYPVQPGNVQSKVEELAAALKNAGLWLKNEPAWVRDYQSESEKPDVDFFEWLQFVYLPNRLMSKTKDGSHNQFITMQVKKYATGTLLNSQIVRLLVELDAL